MKLKDKGSTIKGGSLGLDKMLATYIAREGAKVVIVTRTEVENQQLPSTIYKTIDLITSKGGYTLPIRCDVASE